MGNMPGAANLVRVSFLDPADRDGQLQIGLRRDATGIAGDLFPVLDGDFTLSAAGGRRQSPGASAGMASQIKRRGIVTGQRFLNKFICDTYDNLPNILAAYVVCAHAGGRTNGYLKAGGVLSGRPDAA
ncbi:MAG TPA: hypothetical protein VMA72_31150 [Streptosporangiaceae bacterium]|nr:hypothetical protein [Streptosporangiaceae bacterium]